MPVLQGLLSTVAKSASQAVEVWFSAPTPREGELGNVVMAERARIPVVDGQFEVDLEPGRAVMTVVYAQWPGESVQLLVEDEHTTVAEAVAAAVAAGRVVWVPRGPEQPSAPVAPPDTDFDGQYSFRVLQDTKPVDTLTKMANLTLRQGIALQYAVNQTGSMHVKDRITLLRAQPVVALTGATSVVKSVLAHDGPQYPIKHGLKSMSASDKRKIDAVVAEIKEKRTENA